MKMQQTIVDTDKQEKLEELLKELVHKVEADEEELVSCTIELCNIYYHEFKQNFFYSYI